eukprot:593239_1
MALSLNHCNYKTDTPFFIMNSLPSVLVYEIFTFFNINDYICNVMLVCKSWNGMDDDKFIENYSLFIREVIYNSCKHKLEHIDKHITKYDLIHEYELSASCASIYNDNHPVASLQAMLYHKPMLVPTYPLYFNINPSKRKQVSYRYLFHYIFLYKFGCRNMSNLEALSMLLIRLMFSGGALCSGYMLDLLFAKYGSSDSFWYRFLELFRIYLLHHPAHMRSKQQWVIIQNGLYFLSVGNKYIALCRSEYKQPWFFWIKKMESNSGRNLLCDTIKSYPIIQP